MAAQNDTGGFRLRVRPSRSRIQPVDFTLLLSRSFLLDALIVATGLAVFAALWALLRKNHNLEPPPSALTWNPANPKESLDTLKAFVESEAGRAANWYFKEKTWKARWSSVFRLTAIILTALGGLVPIIAQIAATDPKAGIASVNPLWSSLLVGIAAALFGIDRAFGFSSGWTRYVLAATTIKKAAAEFGMDWEALCANSDDPPKKEQIPPFVQRAKDFRVAVEAIVLQETQEWAAEFQSNLAQLEKDLKTQFDTLKTQVDKQAAANQRGGLELTLTNAEMVQDLSIKLLDEKSAVIVEEKIPNARTWSRLNLVPGNYTVVITASVPATAPATPKPIEIRPVLPVKPGEVTKQTIPIPIT